MCCRGLRCTFLSDRHHPPSLLKTSTRRTPHSSSSFAQRVLEYFDAMPFSVCARHGSLACFRTISLCLDPGLVVGHPRTILVGSSAGGSSVLPSKASTCFMG